MSCIRQSGFRLDPLRSLALWKLKKMTRGQIVLDVRVLMRQAGFLLPLPACVTSNGLLSFREPSFLYVLNKPTFSSFQFSRSVVFDSLRPHEPQPCPSPTPGVYPNSCPLSRWCHPTILSSPSPPALNLSQHQGLFKWVSSLQQVAKLLEFQLQHQSFQWTPRADLL